MFRVQPQKSTHYTSSRGFAGVKSTFSFPFPLPIAKYMIGGYTLWALVWLCGLPTLEVEGEAGADDGAEYFWGAQRLPLDSLA